MAAAEPPLAVDLDGTLHDGDLASACAAALLRRRPWAALPFLLRSLRGRLELKEWLAERAEPDMARLRWIDEVVSFVREESERGRRTVLATAAVAPIAEKAAGYLEAERGLRFDEVLSSTAGVNLLGGAKADAIARAAGGDGAFDYVGDSPKQDPAVFARARVSHFVNPTEGMIRAHAGPDSRVFRTGGGRGRGIGRRLLDIAQARN